MDHMIRVLDRTDGRRSQNQSDLDEPGAKRTSLASSLDMLEVNSAKNEQEVAVVKCRQRPKKGIQWADQVADAKTPLVTVHSWEVPEDATLRIVCLLLHPTQRKFEFVHVEYDNCDDEERVSVKDALSQIRSFATNPLLKKQRYKSLCTNEQEMISILPLQNYNLQEGAMVVAVPKKFAIKEIRVQAAALLSNKVLARALRKAKTSGRALQRLASSRELAARKKERHLDEVVSTDDEDDISWCDDFEARVAEIESPQQVLHEEFGKFPMPDSLKKRYDESEDLSTEQQELPVPKSLLFDNDVTPPVSIHDDGSSGGVGTHWDEFDSTKSLGATVVFDTNAKDSVTAPDVDAETCIFESTGKETTSELPPFSETVDALAAESDSEPSRHPDTPGPNLAAGTKSVVDSMLAKEVDGEVPSFTHCEHATSHDDAEPCSSDTNGVIESSQQVIDIAQAMGLADTTSRDSDITMEALATELRQVSVSTMDETVDQLSTSDGKPCGPGKTFDDFHVNEVEEVAENVPNSLSVQAPAVTTVAPFDGISFKPDQDATPVVLLDNSSDDGDSYLFEFSADTAADLSDIIDSFHHSLSEDESLSSNNELEEGDLFSDLAAGIVESSPADHYDNQNDFGEDQSSSSFVSGSFQDTARPDTNVANVDERKAQGNFLQKNKKKVANVMRQGLLFTASSLVFGAGRR